jgi:hypothetical protein
MKGESGSDVTSTSTDKAERVKASLFAFLQSHVRQLKEE